MRTFLKFVTIVAITVPAHIVLVLALVGVPKPPWITSEDVDRIEWDFVFEDLARRWETRNSTGLVAWSPDGQGVFVQQRRWLFDVRLHHLGQPAGEATYLPQIPRNAQLFPQFGRDHAILSWDTGGNEQHRLYRWDLDGDDPVLLTTDDERASFGTFEPNGPRIAYTSTRRNGRDFDVYLMDPRDPSSDQRVLEVDGAWRIAAWSPVADELLLARAKSNIETELHILDLGTGEVRPLTGTGEGVRHGSTQWSRDGSALYYTSDRDTEFMHLRRYDVSTGEETVLSDEIPWDVTSAQQSSDGSFLLLAVNEDGVQRHYTTNPDGSATEPFVLFESGQFSAALHRHEPLVAVNHTDVWGLTSAYVYDLDTGELTLWAGSGPKEMSAFEPRLVRYPTFDEVDGEARQIPAFVYPGEGEGRRPVLIDIHGGPEAQARLRSGVSQFQRAGITVITPNVRGSTGYGRSYTKLDDWYLREDAVRDIGALLDWISMQPDLDPQRVAVIGGSYGGYMVLASMVHYSARLRCGVDIVGVSNFVTFLENTADYRRDLRRAEYGDERIPEMRAFLESIAPLNNAERITSPLMVVQGANDPRVPVGESRQIVERVRANGLDVSYVEASNEGHGFRHPWNAFWAGLAQRQMVQECLIE